MKIAIIYTSISGNTEAIANRLAEKLTLQNHEVHVHEILDFHSTSDLLLYDFTYLGMYTWGDGDYPDESYDFIEDLERMTLENRSFAIFGSGDTSYNEFCGALDLLKELIEKRGGTVVVEPLRIEFEPDAEDELNIEKFVDESLNNLNQTKTN